MKKNQKRLPHVVLIDNYDSFTYNLVDDILKLGFPVSVYRNDVSLSLIEKVIAQYLCVILVFSPGPGRPENAGNLLKIIERFCGQTPMIGICLGHQAIAMHFNAVIEQADEIFHGKISAIELSQHAIFDGLPRKIKVARYHSLVVRNLPEQHDVVARIDDTIMSFVNNEKRIVGFQFHPESILTTHGYQLLEQALNWAGNCQTQGG